jgi:hypothetical protein
MNGRKNRALLSLTIIMVLVCSSFTVFAATTETEYPLPRNAILYSEIEDQLQALERKNPSLMDYEVIGQSAGGKDLYLVTISDAAGMKNLAKYQKFMQDAVNNPVNARKALNGSDIKVPVFFNASIHGNETTGTDGVLKLIDRLLTDKSAETKAILKNCVVLINVCQNPDGRISGHRENATGTDLNRDYITQSQPEVQAVISNIATKWFPTAMIDLHGFMGKDNILLDMCTIPHNPNYEYDLNLKFAQPHAEAIAAELTALTKRDIDIPYKIWEDGWDDYPPIFTPQYLMYLGAIGHTLEVKFPNQQGIDSAYQACLASLKYASKNKVKLLDNQFAIFDRGVKGLSVEKDVTFPDSYIIPMNAGQQQDTLEAVNMIRLLLTNKIIVKQAATAFTADGTEYPAGTYVVPMKQGLRGLANTMLWKGEDISGQASAMYDISAYSFPELYGFDAIAVTKSFTATLSNVTAAPVLKGSLEAGSPKNYIMPVENNDAYVVANSLVKTGIKVYRASAANGAYEPGSFVIPYSKSAATELGKLVTDNAVTIKGINAVTGSLQPVKMQKIAVVGNDGGVATKMKVLGFDVTAVPYYSLNYGYDLEKNGFDALVLTGTEYFWNTDVDSSGISWTLDEVGQKEVIDFAKTHDFIGAGFAGAKLNEATGKLGTAFSFTGNEEDGQTAENGICVMNGILTDPITYNYGANETIFAYAPIWFKDMTNQVVTSASFADKDLYLAGFWKDPGAAAGAPVIIHDKSSSYDAVLFGIEPAFRSYTEGTFGLMANALYYMGYDE